METEAGQLEVPQGSIAEFLCAMRGYRSGSTRNDVVRGIAAPVVAAELRRFAEEAGNDGDRRMEEMLERRADELDGGSRG